MDIQMTGHPKLNALPVEVRCVNQQWVWCKNAILQLVTSVVAVHLIPTTTHTQILVARVSRVLPDNIQ